MRRILSIAILLAAVLVTGLNSRDSDPIVLGQRSPGATLNLTETEGADLYGAARTNGGKLIRSFVPPAVKSYQTLADLGRDSSVIVVARVVGSRGKLTLDGNSVLTESALSVQKVVKGEVQSGSVIKVETPGGTHIFPDGTSVHLNSLNYRRPHKGGTYVLFLRSKEGDASRYELTGQIKGQFQLDFDAGQVWPSEIVTKGQLNRKYSGRRIQEFLVELRKLGPRFKSATVAK
jgi:hypothetical protein